jgi:uncharacterized phage protein (TIGR02220 family)
MAERRMMSKKIIHSDAFLDMPATAQNLYFHLLLEGDDEGFVNSPKRIQRTIGATDGDAGILLQKKFILSFESGVIVIKHWRMHNYIQKDRFVETSHKHERNGLSIKENGSYTLSKSKVFVHGMDTSCTPSIVEDRLVEDSIVENIYSSDVKEIISHLNQICNTSYRPSSTKTATLIKVRLKEGFTLDDFKKVHITKYAEWYGTDMQKYLRPETLYGTKFESYLNQELTINEKYKAVSNHTGMTGLELLKQQGRA